MRRGRSSRRRGGGRRGSGRREARIRSRRPELLERADSGLEEHRPGLLRPRVLSGDHDRVDEPAQPEPAQDAREPRVEVGADGDADPAAPQLLERPGGAPRGPPGGGPAVVLVDVLEAALGEGEGVREAQGMGDNGAPEGPAVGGEAPRESERGGGGSRGRRGGGRGRTRAARHAVVVPRPGSAVGPAEPLEDQALLRGVEAVERGVVAVDLGEWRERGEGRRKTRGRGELF